MSSSSDKPRRWLVVLYPAPPATREKGDPVVYSQVTVHRGPTVKIIEAATAAFAATEAKVEAGGYALVAEMDVVDRFNRPAVAPLQKVPA